MLDRRLISTRYTQRQRSMRRARRRQLALDACALAVFGCAACVGLAGLWRVGTEIWAYVAH